MLKVKIAKSLSWPNKLYSPATKLFLFVLYFIDTACTYAIMLLIMTMNGYLMMVCLSGLTLGYGFTGMKKDFSTTLKESRASTTEDVKENR